jgi:sigma-B regulation protein RsbU (phosphoserine phosphatase)
MSSERANDLSFNQLDLNDFFEDALSGYAIADPDGQLIKVNQTLLKWLGCQAQDITGKRFSDLLSIGGKIYYETHLWPLLRMQGYFDEVALELSCNKGSRIPVLVNALERKDVKGDAQFIWLTVFKATDRLTYEQNLKEAKASLEISLANAQQVTTLRDQLIAILGHDLRNPLGSIIAGVSILSKSSLLEQEQKIIQVITRSSLRMAELINNIMDFARTRLGEGIVINRQPTVIEPVLQDVVEELRTIFPNRQIDTRFDPNDTVICDGPRIAQLLSNLVANAITYGYADTPVQISAVKRDNLFEMTVCNKGDQISANLLDKLFEPFTRESHSPSQNGLGLGLYIAAQIAKAHKAELTVTSSAAETCFVFRLSNSHDMQSV